MKNSLRDVDTGYDLIEQTRVARFASTENLRALQVQIDTTEGYTAFNLDQLLSRQQALALAEAEEIQSLINYNISISRLYASIGRSLERNGIDFDVPELSDE